MTSDAALRRGVLAGLALLVALPVYADGPLSQAAREQWRDENYVRVEDSDRARLFLFSSGEVTARSALQQEGKSARPLAEAIELTRNVDARLRVRGLTLLAGIDDAAALDAALVLLSDPVAAVREEAVQLIIEHPDADIDSVIAIASRDPSSRVREATEDLISEWLDEVGD